MCTVLLPPGVYPIAVKYIISYHILHKQSKDVNRIHVTYCGIESSGGLLWTTVRDIWVTRNAGNCLSGGGTINLWRRVLLRGGNLFVCLFVSLFFCLSVAFFICQGFSKFYRQWLRCCDLHKCQHFEGHNYDYVFEEAITLFFPEIENSVAEEPKTFPLDDCNYWNAWILYGVSEYIYFFFTVKKRRMLKLATPYNVYGTNKEYIQNFG